MRVSENDDRITVKRRTYLSKLTDLEETALANTGYLFVEREIAALENSGGHGAAFWAWALSCRAAGRRAGHPGRHEG